MSFWAGSAAAGLLALPLTAWAGSIRLEADLRGPDYASGTAAYIQRGDDRLFDVTASNLTTSTATVFVLLNRQFVGTIDLDEAGDGELYLDTQQGDDVPVVQEGDLVQVMDPETGTSLLRGVLMRVR
jgi:hypothetical protein